MTANSWAERKGERARASWPAAGLRAGNWSWASRKGEEEPGLGLVPGWLSLFYFSFSNFPKFFSK